MPTIQADIGWLAGIVDGEGCIHLNGSGRGVQVRVNSTDMAIIERVQSVSALLGVTWNLHAYRRNTGIGSKPRHDLYISGSRDVYRLLRILREHLTAKAPAGAAAMARIERSKVWPALSSDYPDVVIGDHDASVVGTIYGAGHA